jgi:tetratricopeptide (TPR) repeat protein
MKKTFTLILVLLASFAHSQQVTLQEWNELAKTDIRLLPKYDNRQKTALELQSDENFINQTLSQPEYKNRLDASNHLIELGFNYLYKGNLKTAMYRFNQAYLLDSTNSDIYLGYGAVYMSLRDFDNAKKQYNSGLEANPKNVHILTDLGTYYLGSYYEEREDENKALKNIDTAIDYMMRSYQIDNTDQNTLFKLSVCYWIKNDCENAWKYYNECKSLGGRPITDEYTSALKKKCKNR